MQWLCIKLKINYIDLSERYLHCQHVFFTCLCTMLLICLFFKTAFLTLCVCVCALMLCCVRVCSLIYQGKPLNSCFSSSCKHFSFSYEFLKSTKSYKFIFCNYGLIIYLRRSIFKTYLFTPVVKLKHFMTSVNVIKS